MRFSCKSCQATFQTATSAPASATFRCPSCNGEMAAAAEVVELWQDRIPTRRYDLDDLRARLDAEREEAARSRGARLGADQIWFAAVQGRQVGPLSAAGIAGLRARGQLSAATLVWREGWPSWVAAEAVAELRPILGLPEETLGRPFPVQPAAPTPPPFDSTYAAARASAGSEPFADPLSPRDKTDPGARIPEPRAASVVADAGPTRAESAAKAPEPGAREQSDPLAPRQPDPITPQLSPSAPRMLEPIPPLPLDPIPPRGPSGPVLLPSPPPAPPALPLADDAELERVASVVFAQAHETESPAGAPTPDPAGIDSGSAQSSSSGPAPLSAAFADGPAFDAPAVAHSPGDPVSISISASSGGSAFVFERANDSRPAASTPGEPLQMVDLSIPSSSDDAAPLRRSRPPSQQQWFSSPEVRSESEPRAPLVLGAALALALVVLWLLMRTR